MNASIADITARLGGSGTVITPIGRLSRFLQRKYAETRLAGGSRAWETPDCLPWGAWLLRSWEALAESGNTDRVFLAPHQQQRLWQSIIESSASAGQILQPVATARQARESYLRCRDWLIPVFPGDTFLTDDARTFRQWYGDYRQRCEDNGWFDEALIAETLLDEAAGIPPQHIVLYGFDSLTPLQERLLSALQSVPGFRVEQINPVRRNTSVVIRKSDDVTAEIRAAAGWARQKLDKGAMHIGIVAPDIGKLHGRIRNIFEDVLCPGNLRTGHGSPPLFNISMGFPLAGYPVINTALSVLALGRPRLFFDEICDLFRTPYIRAAAAESQQRALLEKKLRRYAEHRLDYSALLYSSKHLPAARQPAEFLSCLQNAAEMRDGPKTRPAHAWARMFSSILSAFGWPGDRVLTSDEYQTCREWHSMLGQFAAMDRVGGDMDFNDALASLRNLLWQSGFQPETAESPIQIMGMPAAAGMQFDHLWVMGLSEETWPPDAEPDPFIPLVLQREHGVPRSSPEAGLDEANRRLDELIASSDDVVLSFPGRENDRPLRPAPALRHYPLLPDDAIPLLEDYAGIIHDSRETETVIDTEGPALGDKVHQRGGTGLFRDQAACPFRAFARHRLFAEGLEITDIGLDAPDRGKLVHHMLQMFWERTGSQEALLRLPAGQLDKMISEVAGDCVERYREKYPLTMGRRFALLETERLRIVLYELLEQERQRQPFRVLACEQRDSLHFAGLVFDCRTDRIDELENGHRAIIDYKTGSSEPSVSSWLSVRPDDPQLPLYAVTSEAPVSAVVFAWVRRGNTVFRGFSSEPDLLPGVKTLAGTGKRGDRQPDLDSQIVQWRETLTALAQDFRQGRAVVDPKSAASCRNCDLHALCRIYEQAEGDDEPGR